MLPMLTILSSVPAGFTGVTEESFSQAVFIRVSHRVFPRHSRYLEKSSADIMFSLLK